MASDDRQGPEPQAFRNRTSNFFGGEPKIEPDAFALAGEKAIFDNVKVGYDGNADDDIDDAGDDLVINDAFGGTDITPTYDDNGNLTFDGNFKYTYDAWNRLIKATLDDTDVTIHEAAFDGLGRRVVKTVSNSGDLDGVTEYYHNSNQIIETRDGSGNLETQVYHGTQYIDEVVGQRIANMGRVYVHQDANYNVTGTTDLTARQIERNYYSPYGQLEVAVDSHPFDYDDDGDVDADDYAVTTNGTCTGTATGDCRRMDADSDGDVDTADQTTISNHIANLTTDTELARIPAATNSQRGIAFGHQGLVFDAELASLQNRARQYAPAGKRFMQRDPLGTNLRNQPQFAYARNRIGACEFVQEIKRVISANGFALPPTIREIGDELRCNLATGEDWLTSDEVWLVEGSLYGYLTLDPLNRVDPLGLKTDVDAWDWYSVPHCVIPALLGPLGCPAAVLWEMFERRLFDWAKRPFLESPDNQATDIMIGCICSKLLPIIPL
jgi:RHS repeat-associated protein